MPHIRSTVLAKSLTRVHRKGLMVGTIFVFYPLLSPIRHCPICCPHHRYFPNHHSRHPCAAPNSASSNPPPPLFSSHISLCRTNYTLSIIPKARSSNSISSEDKDENNNTPPPPYLYPDEIGRASGYKYGLLVP